MLWLMIENFWSTNKKCQGDNQNTGCLLDYPYFKEQH